jgi:hypothetical protein
VATALIAIPSNYCNAAHLPRLFISSVKVLASFLAQRVCILLFSHSFLRLVLPSDLWQVTLEMFFLSL